jgi:phospholipid/cholesterol/gamma-HCH transport system substrate-binding protein
VTASRRFRILLACLLAAVLVGGSVLVIRHLGNPDRTELTAYFDNSTGIYPGDEVRILGVPVGKIESIEPQPLRAKIKFWVDKKFSVPADVNAVVLAPTLVTARFIQLTPVYGAGPKIADNAIIPKERTQVPVEWDDLRDQLQKLTQTLQPNQPGGVSTLGAFVNTAADNLRGRGANIRDTVVKLSQTLSILGDQSNDIFGTIKNLALLVSALHDSTDVMQQLNRNLNGVTGLLANAPDEVGTAIADLNVAVTDVKGFVADNREALGTTADKLGEVSQAVGDSLDDVKQALHVFPTTLTNYVNIFEPAHASVTGYLAGTNFSNPINFLCGAIQAASRLNAQQSAKLCVQYLAPIVKNRQYNFLGPIGLNGGIPIPIPIPPFFTFPVGAQARPNEVTFSEDWLRPDYVPPAAPATVGAPRPDGVASATTTPNADSAPLAAEGGAPAGRPRAGGIPRQQNGPPSPVEAPVATDPTAGLPGLMVVPGSGS